ncbi:hypothetical protein SAMN05444396_11134 [Flavobacterium segetis]|uniref:Uncharacterized protein n=1 Tax=Flavobacterium segetis TaxID=271157 RepID=A0A1M5JIU7_9FLAO|nr:hypothetical protein SAMN05444396_11134 [Flavobacterium segetis]
MIRYKLNECFSKPFSISEILILVSSASNTLSDIII